MPSMSPPEYLADLGYSQFGWCMKFNNDIQESLGKTYQDMRFVKHS